MNILIVILSIHLYTDTLDTRFLNIFATVPSAFALIIEIFTYTYFKIRIPEIDIHIEYDIDIHIRYWSYSILKIKYRVPSYI